MAVFGQLEPQIPQIHCGIAELLVFGREFLHDILVFFPRISGGTARCIDIEYPATCNDMQYTG